MLEFTPHFVDGQDMPSDSGQTSATVGPATGETLATVAEGHRLSGLGEDLGLEAIQTFTHLKVNYIDYRRSVLEWPVDEEPRATASAGDADGST